MRRGGRVLILLGIILGLVTAIGTFMALSTTQPPVEQVQTRPVVIAMQNIPDRTEIRSDQVGTQQWPEPVPAGAIGNMSDVIGKLALEPIYQGQLILPQMFIDKGKVGETRSNASYVIPEGKVAASFSFSTIANAIQPGDTVDLMLTLSPSGLAGAAGTARPAGTTTTATTGTEGQPVTQLMLQDVLILNIGSWGAAPSGSQQQQQQAPGGEITFALDRQDALALKSASEQGSIQLILRRAGDHKQVTTEPVTLQYINNRFNFNLLTK